MKIKLFFPVEFGKAFIPDFIRPRLRRWLLKAGITEIPVKFFGFLFYLSLFISSFIFVIGVFPAISGKSLFEVMFLSFISWLLLELSAYLLLFVIYYLYIEQRIYIRTQKMEEVLEDFLHLVSENLKGGLTLEESFWDAVRPEFGVLASEIRLAAKRVMTGEDVGDALREFMNMYNSPLLTRSFNLIIQAIEGGSRLSDVMDRVIATITETKRLKQEMAATNMTYVIFITFVVLVISPALFVLSNQFLNILSGFSKNFRVLPGSTAAALPINLARISINPRAFYEFSFWALAIISGSASMIVSIIRKGSIRAGIKLIPFYMAFSIFLFYIMNKFAASLVKSIFGI